MGGFTKIPKLSVGDLGSEGVGDRIGLFDEGGRLVGWKPNAESGVGDFLPLTGGVMSGNIELSEEYSIISNDGKKTYGFGDESDVRITAYESELDYSYLSLKNASFMIYSPDYQFVYSPNSLDVILSNEDSEGIIGNRVFKKQNLPNIFAQLGDIATTNATVTPLSLATLNSTYPTQGTGFKVICPAINIIYIKSSLTTWENLNTNQPVINNSYSTTEQLTGGTWTNGKPIYRKVISGNITDSTLLLLIDADVEDICTHNGTASGGAAGSRIALPNYVTSEVNLAIGEITQEERYYGFEGTSAPTHIRVNSFTRKTTNSGGELFHLSMGFKIVLEYTKTTD